MKVLAAAVLLAGLACGQCAMCFRSAEAQSRARAQLLNRGILILAVPLAAAFLLVGGLAFQRRGRRQDFHS